MFPLALQDRLKERERKDYTLHGHSLHLFTLRRKSLAPPARGDHGDFSQ